MDKKTEYLIIVGIVFCVVIACLSPFIASGDPDGLEKSAEDSNVPDSVEQSYLNIPMPDYTIGDSSIGEVAALIIGALVTLCLGYGLAYVVRKHN
ncbi:cobalt ABC transporter permease [Methanobrevibacter sp. 87.7]|uniref:PDGLE domain-containing protein n=1 Tax=Methanobrevibacter sp. 87.7 TaxID=387957 RepID=UPI000B504810|nr:PDGLE domain-containing protein [Methanobrevibacter sp. 87.7]OWT33358.1 cobalt ABC transporter permease [Methanobrevibacter sp. 87.7]